MKHLKGGQDSWGEEALPLGSDIIGGKLDKVGPENHRKITEAKPYSNEDLDNSRMDTKVAIDVLLSNEEELLKSAVFGGEKLNVLESEKLRVGVGSLANFEGMARDGNSLDLDRVEVKTEGNTFNFIAYKDRLGIGEFSNDNLKETAVKDGKVRLFEGDKRFKEQLVGICRGEKDSQSLETWRMGGAFMCYLVDERNIYDISGVAQNTESWENGVNVKPGQIVFVASKEIADLLGGINDMPQLPLFEGEDPEVRSAQNIQRIILECLDKDGKINWPKLHKTISFWCAKNKSDLNKPSINCYMAAQIK